MGTVTLRFHGRFLFSEARPGGVPTGELTVIAPNFDGTGFGSHRPLMTIKHGQLAFIDNNDAVVTTLEPLLRVTDPSAVSGTPSGNDPQLLVWDLKGLALRYQAVGSASEPDDPTAQLMKLKELEKIEGRTALLSSAALSLDSGKTNALYHLTSGAGVAFSTGVTAHFAREDAIKAGKPEPVADPDHPGQLLTRVPAEVVEFVVTFTAGQFLTLNFFDAANTLKGSVCVTDGAVVAFSDSCAALQAPTEFDLEFSRYYDLLTEHGADALIPGDLAGLSEGIPCWVISSIDHE